MIGTEHGDLRKAILKELRRVYPKGRQPSHLAWLIKNSRVECNAGAAIEQLNYLRSVGLVEELDPDPIDAAAPRFWRLTHKGIDYHDAHLA